MQVVEAAVRCKAQICANALRDEAVPLPNLKDRGDKVGIYVGLAILFAAVIAFVIYRYERSKNTATGTPQSGSAFARIAEADTKALEAEGKIIAVKAAAAQHKALAETQKEAALAAHATVEAAHKAFDEVHSILG